MKVGWRLHAKTEVSDADVLTAFLRVAAAPGSVRPTSLLVTAGLLCVAGGTRFMRWPSGCA
jgi:hypothetical protein